MTRDAAKPDRIRLGMVGGGRDAFIGGVHRIASRIDDHYELVAGAFSSTEEKALGSARDLGIADDRAYSDFTAMAAREAQREDGIEAVSIVTPNHLHFAVAEAFLKQGIHVICDKPLTASLADAKQLVKLVEDSESLFILTHNYTAYPMIRQAREMVRAGQLGELRVVQAEYAQDWLATNIEESGQKQAGWRTDPERSGLGGCIGDIGTHAMNLVDFVTGLTVSSLCADLHTFVDGRALDDNAHVMLRFEGGARGLLWASQVAVGSENGLRMRIYGTEGGIEWYQEDPNYLWFTPQGGSQLRLTRGGPGATEASATLARIPAGHPEGYLEAFATLYSEAAQLIRSRRKGTDAAEAENSPATSLLPSVQDGLAGVAFVSAVVDSSRRGGVWTSLT